MTPVTAQRTYQMLGNAPLWETTSCVNELLSGNGINYAIAGGVAVCLHGYRRNTVDLDLLIRSDDFDQIRTTLEADGIVWNAETKEFQSPSGVAVQLLLAGDSEGPGQPTVFPDPSDARHLARLEGLPVLALADLIQSKIACGLGNLRRTHKDFADVVELIAINRLDKSFARFLHKSVRAEFRELVRRAAV
jgi:hypothetical protein